MDGKKILKKARRSQRWMIFFTILVLVIGIGTFLYKEGREKWEAPTFKLLAVDEAMGDPGEYVALDVEYMTEAFVIYGNENTSERNQIRFHFAICDGKIYIAQINFGLLKELQPIMKATYYEEDFPDIQSKKIYGITQEPDEELKKIAIDAYNKIFALSDDEKITMEDYEFAFGKVFLNTDVDFVDTNIEDTIIMMCILIVVFMMIIISVLSSNRKRTNKYLKKNNYENELIKEFDDEKNLKSFRKEKIIITKNFLVDLQSGFIVVKFSDFKWIYEIETSTSKGLMIHLKDGKTKVQVLEYSQKDNNEYQDVLKIVLQKLPKDCINGNSKKEKEEYKIYKKSL